MSGQAVLSEIVESLQETFAHVFGLVKLNTFAFIHLVVEEPNREASLIHLLLELIDTFTFLVLYIDHESLEVEQVEGGWRKEFQSRFNFLVLELIVIVIIVCLGFRGSSFGNNLWCFFNLCLDLRLDCFLSDLDVTTDGNKLGEGCNALEPSCKVAHGLAEAAIENGLLRNDEVSCNNNVRKSAVFAYEPVFALKSNIEVFSVGLDCVDGSSKIVLSDFAPAVNCVNCVHGFRDLSCDGPKAPLVDLCSLSCVGTEQGSVTMRKILGNSKRLAKIALWGGKEGVLSSDVDGLEFLGVLGFF